MIFYLFKYFILFYFLFLVITVGDILYVRSPPPSLPSVRDKLIDKADVTRQQASDVIVCFREIIGERAYLQMTCDLLSICLSAMNR